MDCFVAMLLFFITKKYQETIVLDDYGKDYRKIYPILGISSFDVKCDLRNF
jgi:hypothetical protein